MFPPHGIYSPWPVACKVGVSEEATATRLALGMSRLDTALPTGLTVYYLRPMIVWDSQKKNIVWSHDEFRSAMKLVITMFISSGDISSPSFCAVKFHDRSSCVPDGKVSRIVSSMLSVEAPAAKFVMVMC